MFQRFAFLFLIILSATTFYISCDKKSATEPEENDRNGTTSKIAFLSNREPDTCKVFIMDIDGSNVTRISDKADYQLTPKWSPNGQVIFYAKRTSGRI